MKKSVIGIVETQIQAERIVAQLQNRGIASSDISALFPDTRGGKDFAHVHNTKAPEGAVAGGGIGGVIGGTLGLLAGIGSLAIPGVGPLIAAGPLMAALSGAAAGAAVGGVAGGLVGLGMPEAPQRQYPDCGARGQQRNRKTRQGDFRSAGRSRHFRDGRFGCAEEEVRAGLALLRRTRIGRR
jgi:hypothetical protein